MKELYDIFKEDIDQEVLEKSKSKRIKEGRREGIKEGKKEGRKEGGYKYITNACKRWNNFSRRFCKKSKSKCMYVSEIFK